MHFDRWQHALLAAQVFALDHTMLGIRLRGPADPLRAHWLACWRAVCEPAPPLRMLPAHIDGPGLEGTLDLAGTLADRRPRRLPGLLERARGAVLVVTLGGRVDRGLAARIAAAVEAPCPVAERLGLLAFDESADADADQAASPPGALDECLAIGVDLRGIGRTVVGGSLDGCEVDRPWALRARERVSQARERLARVTASDDDLQSLCEAARALGIDSMRAPWQALRAARCCAALAGRERVSPDDLRAAGQLVLASHARHAPAPDLAPAAQAKAPPEDQRDQRPQAPPEAAPEAPSAAEPEPSADVPADAGVDAQAEPPAAAAESAGKAVPSDSHEAGPTADASSAMVLAATRAALPPGLLGPLAAQSGRRPAPRGADKGARLATDQRALRGHGRPIGSCPGDPRRGRLALWATLNAALPWQRLRAQASPAAKAATTSTETTVITVPGGNGAPRIRVYPSDLRILRCEASRTGTTIFVVDASGSTAMQRLAEAKGAVEQVLAECYVRRDQVALIAFRGLTAGGAEIVLPPTRSLARARRELAGLAGGGGTPLAAGIDCARRMAATVRRGGAIPLVVVLSDGRANLTADGRPGRALALEDALRAATALQRDAIDAVWLDIAPQPHVAGRQVADALGARYLPLPAVDAACISRAVLQAASKSG